LSEQKGFDMAVINELASRPKLILTDVYETLLDMSEVQRRANVLFDSKRGYTIWFELFMEYCFVDNCIKQFNSFDSIAKATMQMTAQILGHQVEEEDVVSVLELLKHLPVNDCVQDGLSSLQDRSFRIAALTNAPENTVRERMERTGLISYFETVLSAEHVKKYKPDVEVYQWALKKLQVEPQDVLMVTSHGWDIAGAANAGLRTAYLKKSTQVLYPLTPQPDIRCKDLEDLAKQLEGLYVS
jgi:2-haloacid dehalogenase